MADIPAFCQGPEPSGRAKQPVGVVFGGPEASPHRFFRRIGCEIGSAQLFYSSTVMQRFGGIFRGSCFKTGCQPCRLQGESRSLKQLFPITATLDQAAFPITLYLEDLEYGSSFRNYHVDRGDGLGHNRRRLGVPVHEPVNQLLRLL